MAHKKRRAGRPTGGYMDLDPEKVYGLPPGDITMHRLCVLLDVAPGCVDRWRQLHDLPVTKVPFKARYYVNREQFIEWAKRNGRLK